MTPLRRYDVITGLLCAVIVTVPAAAMLGALDMQDPALEPETTLWTATTNTPGTTTSRFSTAEATNTATSSGTNTGNTTSSTTPATHAASPSPSTGPADGLTTTAARSAQIPLTTPPVFDPVGYVNSLDYCWTCMPPAMEAYRTVAAWYGWDPATIEARAGFVEVIMATESAGCPNARAWSHHTAAGMPCEQIGQGNRDDVGFGQITNVLRPLTCEKVGVCSIAETIASPWQSMTAFVAVLDELGKRPWCYLNNTHIRNGHCARWPA